MWIFNKPRSYGVELDPTEREFFINNQTDRSSALIRETIQNSLDALKNKPIGPEPPIIRLTGRQEEGAILICIRDNGEGVEPKNLSKMFDPFFTTRDIGKGMGMGLSICYRIIQELNGTITVTSERGKFCEFMIRLPAATEESIAA